MPKTGVIIVAGGGGSRMGAAKPKQFLFLGNEPLLVRTIRNFAEALPGSRIVVVLPEAHIDYWHNLSSRFDVPAHQVVPGGPERFYSVRNGLAALADDTELIAVQDGVRPLGSKELILRTVTTAETCGTAIPVVEPVDSFRETDAEGSHPLDRRRLRAVQTPQVFRADWLREAYKAEFRPEFTDDASVAEAAGHAICLCEGERSNLKITTPEDLMCAAAILENLEENDGAHL